MLPLEKGEVEGDGESYELGPVQSDLQSEYFKELHCLSIINAYTQYARIANPPELNEKLCHSCNYSTIIFTKINKNTIISLKMYLFANMTVFLLKNILFSQ